MSGDQLPLFGDAPARPSGVRYIDALDVREYTVLSLWQPWASLVVLGEKRWETRHWWTKYRGRLLIHATKSFARENRDLCAEEPFRSALARHGITEAAQLPLGAILGQVTLVALRKTETGRQSISPQERAFGDYSDGRWMWQLGDPRVLREPIPAKGGRMFWTWMPPY